MISAILIILASFLVILLNGFAPLVRHQASFKRSFQGPNHIQYSSPVMKSRSQLSASEDETDIDIDMDINPTQMLLLSLQMRVDEVFEALNPTGTDAQLSMNNMILWEKKVNALCKELRQLKDKKLLLEVYSFLLLKAAPTTLDPIRISTFELLSNSVMDTLVSMLPKDEPVTGLIDEITETNLAFIEKFKDLIDDGGDEGYSQSSRMEFLGYQFASLVQGVYGRISKGLGKNFDSSQAAVEMRQNSWASPVYARLQRRFVRFMASNVEERTEEMNAEAFNLLLDKLDLKLAPPYTLVGPTDKANAVAVSGETDDAGGVTSGNLAKRPYSPWELASFVLKVVRNTISCVGEAAVEPKISQMFRNELTFRMKTLGRKLENINRKSAQSTPTRLTTEEVKVSEDMLNLGHQVVAACLACWHIRHNVVGVPDPNDETKYVKDFISPISFKSPEAALECIPKMYRVNVDNDVSQDLASRLAPSPSLEAISLVSRAMRDFVSEEFRALITYDIGSGEAGLDRDGAYIACMAEVLVKILLVSDFDEQWMRENLLAMVVLEETMATREPRAAITEAYQRALTMAALQIRDKREGGSEPDTEDLKYRVNEIERALCMMCRLPEEIRNPVRVVAFKDAIREILEQSTTKKKKKKEADGKASQGLRAVEREYEWIAKMLSINPESAKKNYVAPMGKEKFDRVVTDLLMNTELTIALPQLGSVFEDQILKLADDVMMSEQEADERVGYILGGVFVQIIQTALQQYGTKMNSDRVDSLLNRAYSLYKHPLVLQMRTRLEAAANAKPNTFREEMAMKMVCMNLGLGKSRAAAEAVIEIARMLDESRQRAEGGGSKDAAGWGDVEASSVAADVDYIEYLRSFQEFVLKEYAEAAAGSIS